MIIRNNGDGFSASDYYEQEAKDLNKRLQPSNPTEFIKWISQTVRLQRAKLNNARGKHLTLVAKADRATVNLKRLELITPFGERFNLDRMQDMHRQISAETANIGFDLDRCKSVLDETTANYQFVGESLKKGLTDRHKKIAVQKELGLRLKDLDDSLSRCDKAVDIQNKHADDLLRSVRKLLTRLKAELPPSERDRINKEDRVQQIARRYGKILQGGKLPTGKVKEARNLGQFAAEPAEELAPDTTEVQPKMAVAAGKDFVSTPLGKIVLVGAGIALGHILITTVIK